MKKKILIVFGTRPEAIKMAPLIIELKKHLTFFKTSICVTGQHRQMLDSILDLFEITPDYDLDIMKHSQDLFDITSNVLLRIKDVLLDFNPDLVLVHGDTSTSLVSALAAFYQKIPVGHVEAGLRTWNVMSPWPEEMNRQITTRIASFHFTPSNLSKQNLLKEGIDNRNIIITGNTVIDALYWVINKIEKEPNLELEILKQLQFGGIPINQTKLWVQKKRKMILITGHRRENFGSGFVNICLAIKELAKKYKDVDFVYPMHLNPKVREAINIVFHSENHIDVKYSNLIFIEPLDYMPFVYLMKASYFIITDSGGIQEEGPSLGKPVLVMRETTERPEALEAGTIKLTGTNKEKIIAEVENLLNNQEHYDNMVFSSNPYGDGSSSHKIVKWLLTNDQNFKFGY